MIFSSDKIFLGDLQPGVKAAFAIFLSGSGTNAEVLLNDQRIRSVAEPTILVTDAPEKSRAGEIAAKHNLPLAALSIREFYRQHGLNTISLATEEGRRVRELWTQEMRQMLKEYRIDFAVLAGFESLTNLTNDYPCINVHPGDLTVTDSDGNRLYTGLHSKPIEAAVLAGETSLRSSVIIAMPFTDANKDMDNLSESGKTRITAFGMPDYTAGISIANNETYTAPCDGVYIGGGSGNNGMVRVTLYDENDSQIFQIGNRYAVDSRSGPASVVLPVPKGYKIRITDYNNGVISAFYPLTGAN